MAEIDAAARRITVSVGELLQESARRAIGLGGTGLSRLWIGQELHRRVQQAAIAAEPGYRAEVPAHGELAIDGWTLVIDGRADGVLFAGDTPIRIDEIKTLHFAVDLNNLYAEERLERFKQQARLYAFLLSTADHPAAARLIAVDIVSGEERAEDIPWSHRSVEAWLRRRLHSLVSREQRRLEHREAARTAATALRFPHPEVRPVQQGIVAAVEDSLTSDRNLLISAPTGSGKTAAVLYPALRTALERGQRLFYLTSKTLQQTIAVETARAMHKGGFTSLQLRAKSRMCAHTEMICHEELCPYARDYSLKLNRSGLLTTLLDEPGHLDPDEIFEASVAAAVCPFEVSLELLDRADLVVCDYNYVFDPTIGLEALLRQGALEETVLVIDEAHNLVDRSRAYYSPELSTTDTSRARAFLEGRSGPVFGELADAVADLERLIVETVNAALETDQPGGARAELPEPALGDLRLRFDGLMLTYWLYKREHDLWLADDPVYELFLTLSRLHRVLRLGGEELVEIVERSGAGQSKLRILCLDAARFVGALIETSAGTVAMSATLEPFEFFCDTLGFDRDRTDTLRVPSPFPEENRLVIVVPEVHTTYRRRTANYDPIAGWIARLAHAQANVLVLFPSYRFLEAVADRLPPVAHTVIRQLPGAAGAHHRRVLEALANGRSHLVLAVLGGMFAEGVDYPGEMLSQVIVVSPGLPQFNSDRELLRAYYRERYEHGFEYAYLIPGMTRVVQAAGRLIRSADDRGVIVLMGRRFIQPQYLGLLPEEWAGETPEDLLPEDPEASVRRFFEG